MQFVGHYRLQGHREKVHRGRLNQIEQVRGGGRRLAGLGKVTESLSKSFSMSGQGNYYEDIDNTD